MENNQQQASTMRKINVPSDNPVAAAKLLEIRSDKINTGQFKDNMKLAEMFLGMTDHALGEMANTVLRAKEIAINQASGASANEDTRVSVAEEVAQLYNQAVGLGNTRIGDRYIFGGFKTDRPPVSPDGSYQGDDGHIMVEIGRDVFLAANMPGVEAFNTRPEALNEYIHIHSIERPGVDAENTAEGQENGEQANANRFAENVNVFDELQSLRIGLLSSDTTAIQNTLDRLDRIHNGLVSARAKIGSRLSGVKGAEDVLERRNITNAELSSSLEDADMAKVMGDLAREETVFRSVLASSKRLIQPTLMDFLK